MLGGRTICRIYLVYIYVMMTFLALEVELWVSILSLSGLLHTENDSMDVQK